MKPLTREQRLMLCGRAFCDQRTLDKYLAGKPVRPLSAEKIQLAAEALGLTLPTVEVSR